MPQPKPTSSCRNLISRVGGVDERLQDADRRDWQRHRNNLCALTGSYPPWLNGLQRSSRHAASTIPRSGAVRLQSPRPRTRSSSARTCSGAAVAGEISLLVEPDRQRQQPRRAASAASRSALVAPPAGQVRASRAARSARAASRRAAPARPGPRSPGARRSRSRGRSGSSLAERPERLAQQALDLVALDGAADACGRPTRRAAAPRRCVRPLAVLVVGRANAYSTR